MCKLTTDDILIETNADFIYNRFIIENNTTCKEF